MTISDFLALPDVRARLESADVRRALCLSGKMASLETTLRQAVVLRGQRDAWALLAGLSALAGAAALHLPVVSGLVCAAAGLVFAVALSRAFAVASDLTLFGRLAHSQAIAGVVANADFEPLVLRYLTLARRQRSTWFGFDGRICAALAGAGSRHLAERKLLEKTYP